MSPFKTPAQPVAPLPRPSGAACATCVFGGQRDDVWDVAPAGGFLTPDGAMRLGVMLVADALSDAEASQAKSLVGAGGALMGRAFSRKGWGRDAFRHTAALYCQPGEPLRVGKMQRLTAHAATALAHCPYLDADIAATNPRVIVTFGETAFERVTGFDTTGMRDIMKSVRGYVFRDRTDTRWVVPTYHPEWLRMGQQHLTQVFLWDVEKAVRIAADGYAYDTPTCLMDPALADWDGWIADAMANLDSPAPAPLALDIETPYKAKHADDEDDLDVEADPGGGLIDDITEANPETWTITRVSMCFEADRGVSASWAMPWLIGIRQVVTAYAERGLITIWNRPFDRPRVERALSLAISIGRTRDAMDGFHVLFNALPRKLGYATSCLPSSRGIRMWKHLANVEPAFYSTIDAIVLWRNDRDIERLLRASGQAPTADLFLRRWDPVLEFMSAKGIRTDPTVRNALRVELVREQASLKATMDDAVPVSVKRIKKWQTEAAAIKGQKLLIANEVIGEGIPLEKFRGVKKVKRCTVCQSAPVTKAHTTAKTTLAKPEPSLLDFVEEFT